MEESDIETDIELIIYKWMTLAKTQIYEYRGVDPLIIDQYFPTYAGTLINRSKLHVIKTGKYIDGILVYEKMKDFNIIHFAWSRERNKGTLSGILKSLGIVHNIIYTSRTKIVSEIGEHYHAHFIPQLLLETASI